MQSLSAFNKQHSALQSLYNQQLMESNDTYQPEVSDAAALFLFHIAKTMQSKSEQLQQTQHVTCRAVN